MSKEIAKSNTGTLGSIRELTEGDSCHQQLLISTSLPLELVTTQQLLAHSSNLEY